MSLSKTLKIFDFRQVFCFFFKLGEVQLEYTIALLADFLYWMRKLLCSDISVVPMILSKASKENVWDF